MEEETTTFLGLTDYVASRDLCRLSAETLQGLVCGSDGKYLEYLQERSGVDLIEFVPNPIPGFRIAGKERAMAKALVEQVLAAIKAAAQKVAPKQQPCLQSPPHALHAYHPLFSTCHLIPEIEPLLPLPAGGHSSPGSAQSTCDGLPRPLTLAQCQLFISSPYLQRRRVNEEEKIFASPPLTLSKFETEIADCLPGVPGVRQSAAYKKLRRKVSEIDQLVERGVGLDFCQSEKVKRRPEVVADIRRLLRGEAVRVEQVHETQLVEEILLDPIQQAANTDWVSSLCKVRSADQMSETTTDLSIDRKLSKRKSRQPKLAKAAPVPAPAKIEALAPPSGWSFVTILHSIIATTLACLAEFFIGTSRL